MNELLTALVLSSVYPDSNKFEEKKKVKSIILKHLRDLYAFAAKKRNGLYEEYKRRHREGESYSSRRAWLDKEFSFYNKAMGAFAAEGKKISLAKMYALNELCQLYPRDAFRFIRSAVPASGFRLEVVDGVLTGVNEACDRDAFERFVRANYQLFVQHEPDNEGD